MYNDPSRRDTDVERTIIEGVEPPRPSMPPPGYPLHQQPEPDRGSGFPMWALGLGAIAALICIAAVILGALLVPRFLGSPAGATLPPASATLPQQQGSPAVTVTPAITEIAAIPTTDKPTVAPTVTASPTSAFPAVAIQPYCEINGDSPTYVEVGQPVTLTWTWRATAIALVQDHLNAAIYTILLDGEEVLAQTQSDIEYDTSDATYPYRVTWTADVGVLAPGEHLASRGLEWSAQISDGVATFGPGGQYPTLYATCRIVVE